MQMLSQSVHSCREDASLVISSVLYSKYLISPTSENSARILTVVCGCMEDKSLRKPLIVQRQFWLESLE